MNITVPENPKHIKVILSDDVTRNISTQLCEIFPETIFGTIYKRWLDTEIKLRQELIFEPQVDNFLISSKEWDLIINYLQIYYNLYLNNINFKFVNDNDKKIYNNNNFNMKLELENRFCDYFNKIEYIIRKTVKIFNKINKIKNKYDLITLFNLPNDIGKLHKELCEKYLYLKIDIRLISEYSNEKKYYTFNNIKYVYFLKHKYDTIICYRIILIFNTGNLLQISIGNSYDYDHSKIKTSALYDYLNKNDFSWSLGRFIEEPRFHFEIFNTQNNYIKKLNDHINSSNKLEKDQLFQLLENLIANNNNKYYVTSLRFKQSFKYVKYLYEKFSEKK